MSKSLRGYMAGLINPNYPESYEWRVEARNLWGSEFELIDPVSTLPVIPKQAYETKGMYAEGINGPTIMMKDWFQVERADFLLVNFDEYGSDRPLTGTIFELAWAWTLKMPVIGFGRNIKPHYRNHPFIAHTVIAWFDGWDDALDYVFTHFVK